ncbi:hypothetical protein H7I77_24815 [Mycolicibacterium novocastrense]|uniref:Uncharacterized protein n=1 Tax=Mycolicibacterium novocastrense TaxID=59813 RepID=A0AAW5SSJ1_MYCNV|nr:hypothetical protein [Mycolicibacterium novocastrense]MCV7026540.1 hypothetical protein [Mycolicibacterium novocastrense]GAT08464.1 uncharacterized protein RMCN_1597 [Mycolicibacterium novocastrense]
MGEREPSGQTELPDDLVRWQELLERAFFRERDPSGPFILDLELSDEIRQWTAEQNPSAQLGRVVARYVDLDNPLDVFGPLRSVWRKWAVGDRRNPPPNLAVLALTVAAASEMHRDESAVSHAYYYRLAQLVAPDESHESLEALRQRLAESFDLVAHWWSELSDWVDANPQVGVNTIRKHDRLTRIGYPLSQALLRRSDRMRLTRFFDRLDLRSLDVPEEGVLLSKLELWAATPRDLSPTLLSALTDPARRRVLASYLHRLAREWDGVVLTPEGATQLDIRLAVDLDDFTSQWVIFKHPQKSQVSLEVNDELVELTSGDYGAFYNWQGPMPAVVAWPSKPSVVVKGTGVAGRFAFPPLQPMRSHPDVGWLSEDDVEPYTPHILLVAPVWQNQIEKVLDAAARRGWRRLGQQPGAQLVVGRLIYIRVEIENLDAFKNALTQIDPSLARLFRSSACLRPRLVNGLHVFTDLGNRHYLQGGEPDLFLPAGDIPRTVPAALDGMHQEHPFQATGLPIPLRVIGPLNVGKHVLEVDGETLTFNVHTSGTEPVSPSSTLGWLQVGRLHELRRVGIDAVGVTAISGAIVNGSAAEPHFLRRAGRQYFVVDRRGTASAVSPPPPNPLFEQAGIPNSAVWELLAPDDAVWLFEERHNGEVAARRLRYAEPLIRDLDSYSRHLWTRVSEQLRGTNPLLDIYLRAWDRSSAHAR